MATWNRDVAYDSNTGYLVVSEPGAGANPPPVPGKGQRTDTANEITTYAEDRPATIRYSAPANTGVTLTGLTAKANSTAPSFQVTGNGTLLTVTDSGSTGDEYSYYVVGTVSGSNHQTQDPQIHNLGE